MPPSPPTPTPTRPRKVIIIGTGIFGLSTAQWMLNAPEGGYEVVLVDKSRVVPAPDAASTGELRRACLWERSGGEVGIVGVDWGSLRVGLL